MNVGLVRVIFPYKHRFAEAVQGEFVSLFKWIKIIHGIKKKPFTEDSPLPSDLHIKVKFFVLLYFVSGIQRFRPILKTEIRIFICSIGWESNSQFEFTVR